MVIKSHNSQVSVGDEDIKKLATAIAEALRIELAKYVGQTNSPQVRESMTSDIIKALTIDESIIDVGISMQGIEKPEDVELASTTKTEDNVTEAKSRLKALKNKE